MYDDPGMVKCRHKTRYLINGIPFIIECNLHTGAVEVSVPGVKVDRLGFFGVPSVYDGSNLERVVKSVKNITILILIFLKCHIH